MRLFAIRLDPARPRRCRARFGVVVAGRRGVLQTFSFDRAHPYAGGQHRGIDIGGAAGDARFSPLRAGSSPSRARRPETA